MHRKSGVMLLITILAMAACVQNAAPERPQPDVSDRPFASGGRINLQLEAGSYEVQPFPTGDRIRVALTGDRGSASVVTIDPTHAEVTIKNGRDSHFQGTVEVPPVSNLQIRASAGNLTIGPITGDKGIASRAGTIKIAVTNPDEYSSVDASVNAGDIKARPFGASYSGLLPRLTWTGKGTYRMHVELWAGNVAFQN